MLWSDEVCTICIVASPNFKIDTSWLVARGINSAAKAIDIIYNTHGTVFGRRWSVLLV